MVEALEGKLTETEGQRQRLEAAAADNREQAAKLLNKFAKSNQVIFTTCDPAIAELLGGNLIPM